MKSSHHVGGITDVLLFGPAAAGKGTLGRILAALRKGMHYVEMSGILDWITLHNPEMLAQEQHLRDQGKLFSDHLIMHCLRIFMEEHGYWGGVNIYDGPGRSVQQAQELGTLIKTHRVEPNAVVLDIRITLEEALARAAQRRKNAEKGIGSIRRDDEPEIVTERVLTFEHHRPPILDEFKRYATVIEIDANGNARNKLVGALEALKWIICAKEVGLI